MKLRDRNREGGGDPAIATEAGKPQSSRNIRHPTHRRSCEATLEEKAATPQYKRRLRSRRSGRKLRAALGELKRKVKSILRPSPSTVVYGNPAHHPDRWYNSSSFQIRLRRLVLADLLPGSVQTPSLPRIRSPNRFSIHLGSVLLSPHRKYASYTSAN